MNDTMTLMGEYDIIIRSAQTGRELDRQHVKNQLTNINRTLRDAQLMGAYSAAANALQIKYFAFGTGTTAAKATDTALENERFRKQVTTLSNPSAGVVESVVSLGVSDANFTITELGVFCGPAATAAAGTGTLLSRVNVSIYKNDSLVIDIVRTDTCAI